MADYKKSIRDYRLIILQVRSEERRLNTEIVNILKAKSSNGGAASSSKLLIKFQNLKFGGLSFLKEYYKISKYEVNQIFILSQIAPPSLTDIAS